MESLKQYIYLDEGGIDSLYAQIAEEIVVEREFEVEKHSAGEAKGTFSAKLNELLDTGISLSGEGGTANTTRVKTTFPMEKKLMLIQLYVKENENLIEHYGDISRKYKSNSQNFVLLTDKFDTSLDCRDWSNAMRQIAQFEYIPFYKAPSEKADSYEYDDSYYKTMSMYHTKVTMNLGVQKMRDGYFHSFGMTSHMSVLFRICGGENIPLGVFGHLYKLTEDIFQIKPYAVWRV